MIAAARLASAIKDCAQQYGAPPIAICDTPYRFPPPLGSSTPSAATIWQKAQICVWLCIHLSLYANRKMLEATGPPLSVCATKRHCICCAVHLHCSLVALRCVSIVQPVADCMRAAQTGCSLSTALSCWPCLVFSPHLTMAQGLLKLCQVLAISVVLSKAVSISTRAVLRALQKHQ